MTMKKVSDTIQDRLREIDRIDNEGWAGEDCIEAADHIDELEARVEHLHKVVGIERDAANDALGRLKQIEGLAKRRDER